MQENTESAIKKWRVQQNWQHRVHKKKKNKSKTQNWQHRVHKKKKNKTKTQNCQKEEKNGKL